MKRTFLFRITILAALFLAAFVLGGATSGAAAAQGGAYEGEFFIISSVNQRTHELFLKAPTEVTELMAVDGKAVVLDLQGKRVTFKDLRAGDTVYVVASRPSSGEPVASRIQMGPMTAAILHSRYLK